LFHSLSDFLKLMILNLVAKLNYHILLFIDLLDNHHFHRNTRNFQLIRGLCYILIDSFRFLLPLVFLDLIQKLSFVHR